MTKKRWTESDLEEAVSGSQSIAQVLRKLNLVPAGGNYKTIKQAIIDCGLDTDHFLGQGWSKNKTYPQGKRGRSLDEWLTNGSKIGSYKLKNLLLKHEIFEKRCSKCKLTTWNGQDIALELEHINGINNDNRIDNLCLLCPNCHAQTETYRGKNINRAGVVKR